jgi:hypothetical protein
MASRISSFKRSPALGRSVSLYLVAPSSVQIACHASARFQSAAKGGLRISPLPGGIDL